MLQVSEFGAAQLAIQAAVSDAFKTPEVIRMSVGARTYTSARTASMRIPATGMSVNRLSPFASEPSPLTILSSSLCVSRSFRFAQKQPDQLRLRLATLQRDVKIKQITREVFQRQSVEILVALKKMGTDLTPEEQAFMDSMSSSAQLESAVDNVGDVTQNSLLSAAGSQIRRAEK